MQYRLWKWIWNWFFLEINDEIIPFNKGLLTCNHYLDKEKTEINKEVKFFYQNEYKTIKITKNRRVFTNKDLHYTFIEIFPEDNIILFFQTYNLSIDTVYYSRDQIFLLQYPEKEELKVSASRLLFIKEEKFIGYNCPTKQG